MRFTTPSEFLTVKDSVYQVDKLCAMTFFSDFCSDHVDEFCTFYFISLKN